MTDNKPNVWAPQNPYVESLRPKTMAVFEDKKRKLCQNEAIKKALILLIRKGNLCIRREPRAWHI